MERTESTMTAKHVIVTGRVQGVSFRAWTRERAQERGVSGWVRNRPDGSVEAVISGSGEAVETLIAALHTGPPAANVDEVRVTDTESPPGAGFRIVD
jgi:acylphosphatase